jgi:hypothetical protein
MKKEVATVGDVKFPIGVKLAIIIGFIVLVSLGAVTILNSHFVGQDVKSQRKIKIFQSTQVMLA